MYALAGVITQGQKGTNNVVHSFTITTSIDEYNWKAVTENGQEKVFQGHDVGQSADNKKSNRFSGVAARYVRIIPQSYSGKIAMRSAVLFNGTLHLPHRDNM